jgi:hypothetical protein
MQCGEMEKFLQGQGKLTLASHSELAESDEREKTEVAS